MKSFVALLFALGLVCAAVFLPTTTCEPCAGKGKIEANWQKVRCAGCAGKGYRSSLFKKKGVKTMGGNKPMCLSCKGAGHHMQLVAPGGPCLACSGKGKISVYEAITR